MTLSQIVLQYVVPTLLPVLLTALIAGLVKLALYLHSKEKESKIARVFAVVTDLVHSVVAEIDVTLKAKILEASADGVITPEEATQLKTLALQMVQQKLPTWARLGASAIFGDVLDSWLKGLIERAVTQRKASEAVADGVLVPQLVPRSA